MAFRDIRFPEDIEQQFSGGPAWSVTIVETASGHEQRNLNASAPRAKWTASLPIASEQERKDILGIWYGVRGPVDSFRFRDWMDYTAGMTWTVDGSGYEVLNHSDGDASPCLPEVFSLGDGNTATVHQLTKGYSFGSLTYSRKITKPVSPIKIWVETSVGSGVYTERTTNMTINYLTGTVQFTSSAPASGLKIAWSGMFDIPVRFANGDGLFVMDTEVMGRAAISVVEVLE